MSVSVDFPEKIINVAVSGAIQITVSESASNVSNVWRDGSGVPSNALGADGDYYLNNATGDVYNKLGGEYSIVANIVASYRTTSTQTVNPAIGYLALTTAEKIPYSIGQRFRVTAFDDPLNYFEGYVDSAGDPNNNIMYLYVDLLALNKYEYNDWRVNITGEPGRDLYAQAVDNGFTGTEEEYLASLVGPGLPSGGTAGQVLAKIDATDYNTEWIDAAVGGGSTSGENWVLIPASDDTALENGAALLALYELAKLKTPYGSALSATNRYTIVLGNGIYDTGDPLDISNQFIDFVALNDKVNFLRGLQVNVNDVYIKGIDCGTSAFYIGLSNPQAVYINCVGGDGSFGDGIEFSGTAINCVGGDYSFGGSGGAFSGTATNCVAGDNSFCDGETFSGTAINCTAGIESFGGNYGTFSGTANNCVAGNGSYGGYTGTFSGTATNCVGGDECFAGHGNLSGTVTNCVAGNGSFGDVITSTGEVYYCRLTSGTFVTPDAGGIIMHCINGDGTAYPAGGGGTAGSVWRDGTGVPSNALGVNGDYYLNNATGDIYTKSGGTYSIVFTIAGPPDINSYAETPSGTVNSSNVTFTLANTPADVNGVLVLLNGVTQYNGIDYTVSGSTITFTTAPTTGSSIFAYYNTFTASGGGGGPLIYKALLTQTGTDAPVATVLENTLGGTVVWTYYGIGDYRGTLSGAFPENDTLLYPGIAYATTAPYINASIYPLWVSNNVVRIQCDDGDQDGVLNNLLVKIEVYP